MEQTYFGKALRQIRINRGILLKDMADALGYTCPYLSKIETGEVPVPTDLIVKLFSIYDLSEEEIESLIDRCPFCGDKAGVNDSGFFTTETFVFCYNCSAQGEVFYTTAEAITAWNRRVSNDQPR